MSRQLALDTLALKPVPRFARTEYSLEYHQGGLRPATGPAESLLGVAHPALTLFTVNGRPSPSASVSST